MSPRAARPDGIFRRFLILGQGGYGSYRGFMFGFEGGWLGRPGGDATRPGEKARLSGSWGMAQFGYGVVEAGGFRLYPLVGMGSGSMQLRIWQTSRADFDATVNAGAPTFTRPPRTIRFNRASQPSSSKRRSYCTPFHKGRNRWFRWRTREPSHMRVRTRCPGTSHRLRTCFRIRSTYRSSSCRSPSRRFQPRRTNRQRRFDPRLGTIR